MSDSFTQPVFLSVPEAARLCGVTRNTVYTWVKQGKLHAYQTPGRTNRIRPSDLVQFMEQNGMFVPEELSKAAQEDEKLNPPNGGTDPSGDKPAILIVDDNTMARNLVVRALREDYNIFQAETGYEALHLLTLRPAIHVVLLDLHMPGQYGLDTLREIRELRDDVSVVIVTGYREEIPGTQLRNGTVTEVLEKPFRLKDLHEAVKTALASYS